MIHYLARYAKGHAGQVRNGQKASKLRRSKEFIGIGNLEPGLRQDKTLPFWKADFQNENASAGFELIKRIMRITNAPHFPLYHQLLKIIIQTILYSSIFL